MDSDNDLFITQNKFKDISSGPDTDTVINDILDTEEVDKENMPNFSIKNPLLSDISDDEIMLAKERNVSKRENKHFSEPMPDKERDSSTKSRFAQTTEAKSKWAVNLFQGWLNNRQLLQKNRPDIRQFIGILLTMEDEMLDYCLGAFVFEVRKANGENYKGNTLYEVIAAIQHHLRKNKRFVSLFDDESFESMRKCLDKKMKDLAKEGIGIEKRQAGVISVEDEKMWPDGVLGDDTPEKLRDNILYLVGLNFALRGGQEHHRLKVGENSQLKLGIDSQTGPRYLQYTEDVSKTCQGGIDQRKLKRKQTKAYENVSQPGRCLVTLYEKYLSLRPKNGKCDSLYLRALAKPQEHTCYADMKVGINYLSKIVKNLCNKAGMEGFFSNHSLRAAAATRMYAANIIEQAICEKTGHRSDAVRNYKHTNVKQEVHASDVVQGAKRKYDGDGHVQESVSQMESRCIKIRKGDLSIDIPL